VVTIVFQMLTAVIAPVYIAPLFNKYTNSTTRASRTRF